MRFLPRKFSTSVSRSTGSWLTLLLLFVVLVPSIGLLWFLGQAAQNEQLVVRQKLIEAYRAHLAGAQGRLAEAWPGRESDLDPDTNGITAAQQFGRAVVAGTADALVIFDAAGVVVYPDAPRAPQAARPDFAWLSAERLETADPAAAARAYAQLAAVDDVNLAARALQAQARSLIRAADRTAALALLTGPLQQERFRGAVDLQGRLVVANAELLAAELAQAIDADQARAIRERLRARSLDYEHVAMPSAQRRFLQRELQRVVPDARTAALLAAEDLAAAFVAAHGQPAPEPGTRRTTLPDVWQHNLAQGRVVFLHRTENLLQRLQTTVDTPGLSTDARVEFVPPGRDPENALLSLPAGEVLPGWRIALTIADPDLLAATTSQRIGVYAWIVGLLIVVALALAILAGGLVRRQIALTQLRNDLVANVTHELKTPLASMRLLVETLLHAPVLNEQTTREYLQLIATENLRLSRLIGNFLTFSRIERNKYTFDFKPVPPRAIVDSAVAAVGDRFQAPGCRFDVKVAAALPSITADADAVVTALVNLLDNAWKYTGELKEIALTAGARNGSVTFAVHDNGIGLAPRDTKRVFQRFYQVRQPQSTSGGGSGLGLSIVQFIVAAHHGTVHVESEPGRGSTFAITLPALAAEIRDEP